MKHFGMIFDLCKSLYLEEVSHTYACKDSITMKIEEMASIRKYSKTWCIICKQNSLPSPWHSVLCVEIRITGSMASVQKFRKMVMIFQVLK